MSRRPLHPRASDLVLLSLLLTVTACDTSREASPPDGADQQSRAAAALPETAFRVRWDSHTVPPELPRQAEADIQISFTNIGDAVWPDPPSADPQRRDGRYAVRLTYEWVEASAARARSGPRIELPRPIQPGETATLVVHLTAPERAGDYRLAFDLVQELVAWFDTKGAAGLVVPVTVR